MIVGAVFIRQRVHLTTNICASLGSLVIMTLLILWPNREASQGNDIHLGHTKQLPTTSTRNGNQSIKYRWQRTPHSFAMKFIRGMGLKQQKPVQAEKSTPQFRKHSSGCWGCSPWNWSVFVSESSIATAKKRMSHKRCMPTEMGPSRFFLRVHTLYLWPTSLQWSNFVFRPLNLGDSSAVFSRNFLASWESIGVFSGWKKTNSALGDLE